VLKQLGAGIRWAFVLIVLVFLGQIPATSAIASCSPAEPDTANAEAPDYEVAPINTGTAGLETASDSTQAKPQRSKSTTKKWVTEHEETEGQEVVARYHYFTDDGMSEAYTQCFGLMFNRVLYSRTNTRFEGKASGVIEESVGRGDIGLLFAKGTPLRWSSNFEVVDSDLYILAMPIGITILNGLNSAREKSWAPYFGWGLGGIFGFERISGHVTRFYEEFEWHDMCYRQSFEAHALIGVQWNTGASTAGILEVRWTQAGKGRLKRGRFSAEDEAAGWGDVFDEFQHPNFRFTGVSVDVGIRW
jgi:hypothetical protein